MARSSLFIHLVWNTLHYSTVQYSMNCWTSQSDQPMRSSFCDQNVKYTIATRWSTKQPRILSSNKEQEISVELFIRRTPTLSRFGQGVIKRPVKRLRDAVCDILHLYQPNHYTLSWIMNEWIMNDPVASPRNISTREPVNFENKIVINLHNHPHCQCSSLPIT